MKHYLLVILAATMLYITLSSNRNGASVTTFGPEITGCSGSGCHGGASSFDVNFILDSTILPFSGGKYQPGKKYQVKITSIAPASTYGFHVIVKDKTNKQAGILSIPVSQPNAKTVVKSGVTVAEHSNPVNPVAPGFNIMLDWTAPSKGAGEVTFQINVLCSNNNGIPDAMEHCITQFLSLKEEWPATVNVIEENVFNVYPNPANNVLNIDIRNSASNKYHYAIYSMNGVMAAQGHLGNNVNSIDVSTLSSGMHFISITNGTEQKVITFNKL
jgi:hypothetical protein